MNIIIVCCLVGSMIIILLFFFYLMKHSWRFRGVNLNNKYESLNFDEMGSDALASSGFKVRYIRLEQGDSSNYERNRDLLQKSFTSSTNTALRLYDSQVVTGIKAEEGETQIKLYLSPRDISSKSHEQQFKFKDVMTRKRYMK